MKIQDPPIIDPHRVREVFANEVLSIELDPAGACVVTLGVKRLIEQPGERPPKFEREVAIRAAMPAVTLQSLVNQVIKMGQVINQNRSAPAVPPSAASTLN